MKKRTIALVVTLVLVIVLVIALVVFACVFAFASFSKRPANQAEIISSAVDTLTPEIVDTASVISSQTETHAISSAPPSKAKTPSKVSSKPQNDDWKKAYKNFILNEVDPNSYPEYNLIYVDNNNVPELFMKGACEADGSAVCSYYKGKVSSQYFGRINGMEYAEKSGRFLFFGGNTGYYPLQLYSLSNGTFTTEAKGLCEEGYYIEPGNMVFQYTLNDQSVTEAEFNAAKNDWLGGQGITPPFENKSREEMLQLLSQ
ncbi:MAG: hypothetical protein IKU10_05945 [Clostridia bacterium]|nr:hypothetical protein [Clostridia bacterium]